MLRLRQPVGSLLQVVWSTLGSAMCFLTSANGKTTTLEYLGQLLQGLGLYPA